MQLESAASRVRRLHKALSAAGFHFGLEDEIELNNMNGEITIRIYSGYWETKLAALAAIDKAGMPVRSVNISENAATIASYDPHYSGVLEWRGPYTDPGSFEANPNADIVKLNLSDPEAQRLHFSGFTIAEMQDETKRSPLLHFAEQTGLVHIMNPENEGRTLCQRGLLEFTTTGKTPNCVGCLARYVLDGKL